MKASNYENTTNIKSFNYENNTNNSILFNKISQAFYPSDRQVILDNGSYTHKGNRREHYFFIETRYRGKKYPSPFHFQVTFGQQNPNNDDTINFPYPLDEVMYIHIKEISLPVRLLPQYCMNQRYLFVRIRELSSINIHYSNPIMTNSDILIWRLSDQGPYWYGEGKYPLEFKLTNPLSIKRLTFEVFDPNGNPIQIISNLNSQNPMDWKLCIHDKKKTTCNISPDDYNSLCDKENLEESDIIDIIQFKENYIEFNPYFDFNNGFINLYVGLNDKIDLEI